MDIKERLIDSINSVMELNLTVEDVKNDTLLFDELQFDSLSLVQLIIELEEKFNINLDDIEDFSEFESIGGIINYLSEKCQ